MHDGSIATLWDVMDHYNKGGEANPYLDGGIEPLALTETEIDQLVAFMFTLTDERFADDNKAEIERQREVAATQRPLRDNALAHPQEAAVRARASRPTQREEARAHATSAEVKSIETKHMEERDELLRGLANLDRRVVPEGVRGRVRRGRRAAACAPRTRSSRSTSRTRSATGEGALPLRVHLRLASLRAEAERPLRATR